MSIRMISTFVSAAIACLSLAAFADTPSTAPATQSAIAPRIHLWDKTPDVVPGDDKENDPTEPTLDIFLPPQPNGAAVLIFPGGAYVNLSTVKEGRDVALVLNSHQVTAFVLRYRHAPRYHNPIPLEDAQRAIRLVRTNAAEYHIDPHRIGVLGFSAGGHLAAILSTTPDNPNADAADPIDRASARPDFAALLYPVITFTDEPHVHKTSRKALVGDDQKLWAEFSAENRVTKDTPPVFIAQAATDKTVPVENSLLFFAACHRAGVSAELHIFASGNHGFGLAPKNPVLNIWPDLLIHWMATSNWLAPKPATTAP